jgi:hypothetical protein
MTGEGLVGKNDEFRRLGHPNLDLLAGCNRVIDHWPESRDDELRALTRDLIPAGRLSREIGRLRVLVV